MVPSPGAGLLAGFTLCLPDEGMPLSATVLWVERNGNWTEAPEIIAEKLTAAAAQTRTIPAPPSALAAWIGQLAVPIRERLSQVKRQRWIMLDQPPEVRQVMGRLQQLIRQAARSREAKRLSELEHAMAAVAGGHTAGEIALLELLGRAGDSELIRRLGALPQRRSNWQDLEFRLTGMVIFQPAQQPATE